MRKIIELPKSHSISLDDSYRVLLQGKQAYPFFGDSLKRVLKVYPEAKFKWTDAGLTLLPSRPHVERSLRANP